MMKKNKLADGVTRTQLFAVYQARVNQALAQTLNSQSTADSKLLGAMRYAVMNGGKRLRPLLVYAAGEACGATLNSLDHAACAIELIHTYSLVHDDLPAMDNDDLRRGQPACHKAFDEATAILAGDALQTLAFQILAEPNPLLTAQQQLNMITVLAQASGVAGMAGGQALDLAATGKTLSIKELEHMHALKTGALIKASVQLGAIGASATPAAIFNTLNQYADYLGLAFQVQDDILDLVSETTLLGKPTGSDSKHNKPTATSTLGLASARAKLLALHDQALSQLTVFDDTANLLRMLTTYVIQRQN